MMLMIRVQAEDEIFERQNEITIFNQYGLKFRQTVLEKTKIAISSKYVLKILVDGFFKTLKMNR